MEFSLEDTDMSRFKKGATYSQIKAYVQEKHGLKVFKPVYLSSQKKVRIRA
mgnify:CR=1 FL=1